jgi:hypothetical protein
MTLPDSQIPFVDLPFRANVKLTGYEAYYHVEEAFVPNKAVMGSLDSTRKEVKTFRKSLIGCFSV